MKVIVLVEGDPAIKSTGLYKHIPVIIISASPDMLQLAGSAGADSSLSKPFSITHLRAAVSEFIE